MSESVLEYYRNTLSDLHFIKVPEKSMEGDFFYKMVSEYGKGSLRMIDFNNMFIILIADYVPGKSLLKTSMILEDYMEISLFETGDSFYKVGKRKFNRVEKGIFCYINTNKQVQVHCESGKRTRFTKILITKSYYDGFLSEHYGEMYKNSADAVNFFSGNPDIPEINFAFQQLQSCKALGKALYIYMESKVLEILSLVSDKYLKSRKNNFQPVRLDRKDLRSLNRVVAMMKKNPGEYPSQALLARTAGMSTTRFQLAFQKVYGTTAYRYLQDIRMNNTLELLKVSDYSIGEIAELSGYSNAGHFAGLFKKTYGISPKKYRNIYN